MSAQNEVVVFVIIYILELLIEIFHIHTRLLDMIVLFPVCRLSIYLHFK